MERGRLRIKRSGDNISNPVRERSVVNNLKNILRIVYLGADE